MQIVFLTYFKELQKDFLYNFTNSSGGTAFFAPPPQKSTYSTLKTGMVFSRIGLHVFAPDLKLGNIVTRILLIARHFNIP